MRQDAVRSARPSTGGTSRRDRQPNRLNENGRETQERIFNAAEQLFAEHGIDAVSTRDIIDAAGVNGGSIHYHFGTREQLIVALVERRAGYLGVQRNRYLDELEASGEITLRSMVDVLVRPTAELARDPAGRYHAGFIVAVTNKRELMPVVRRVFDQYTNRYLAALARVTPQLDDSTRRLRYGVARDIVNRVVGQRDGALQRWITLPDESTNYEVDEAVVAAVTDMVVAMFAA
ncbi:MAG: helix-turn-helix domain-containing protein [Acidimicrobiales bacterium]